MRQVEEEEGGGGEGEGGEGWGPEGEGDLLDDFVLTATQVSGAAAGRLACFLRPASSLAWTVLRKTFGAQHVHSPAAAALPALRALCGPLLQLDAEQESGPSSAEAGSDEAESFESEESDSGSELGSAGSAGASEEGEEGAARSSRGPGRPGSIASTYWREERRDRKELLAVIDER